MIPSPDRKNSASRRAKGATRPVYPTGPAFLETEVYGAQQFCPAPETYTRTREQALRPERGRGYCGLGRFWADVCALVSYIPSLETRNIHLCLVMKIRYVTS